MKTIIYTIQKTKSMMKHKTNNKFSKKTFILWDKTKIGLSGVIISIVSILILYDYSTTLTAYKLTSIFHYGDIIYFNSIDFSLLMTVPGFCCGFIFGVLTIIFGVKRPKNVEFTMCIAACIMIPLLVMTQVVGFLVTIWLGVFSPYKTCEPEGFRYYYVRDIGDCQRLMGEETR